MAPFWSDTAKRLFSARLAFPKIKRGDRLFPLTVDYEEKFYAAGKIMGSRFIKREGRPSEEAILTARVIDRTIRPLFDRRLRNEIQVVVLALSVDGKNDSDIPAIIAASLALGISDIPWGGPVARLESGKRTANLFSIRLMKKGRSQLWISQFAGKTAR